MARGQGPTAVILLGVLMATAALVGYAALRTLRPLVSHEEDRTVMIGQRTRVALEREKLLTLRSIKELEFDRAMGRLSDEDWTEMSGRLRARAARLMRQLDAGAGYRDQIERDLAKRLGLTDANARLKASRYKELRPARLSDSEALRRRRRSPGREGFSRASDARVARRERHRTRKVLQSDAGAKLMNDNGREGCKGCRSGAVSRPSTRLRLGPLCPCVLCAKPLSAQQGGFAMPDPKQMSGIPRPVDDLPNGAISVRLIRGQLSNNITGHPVELHVGSKVITVKTDESGRAQFNDLTPGATVKATADVDGEHLESQEFPAPARGGIRLMLVATDKPKPPRRRRTRRPSPDRSSSASSRVSSCSRARRRSRCSTCSTSPTTRACR